MGNEVCRDEKQDFLNQLARVEDARADVEAAEQDVTWSATLTGAACGGAAGTGGALILGCALAGVNTMWDVVRAHDASEKLRDLEEDLFELGREFNKCLNDHKRMQPIVKPLPIVTPLEG